MEINFLADIHPRVVHFPIAFLTTYSLLEILGIAIKNDFISKFALLVLCLGMLTSFIAVITGNEAAKAFNNWTDESASLLNSHQNFATYLLWFSLFTCALRIFVVLKKKLYGYLKYIFILFALIIMFLIYQTGTCGGDLVKRYGIGTDMIKQLDAK